MFVLGTASRKSFEKLSKQSWSFISLIRRGGGWSGCCHKITKWGDDTFHIIIISQQKQKFSSFSWLKYISDKTPCSHRCNQLDWWYLMSVSVHWFLWKLLLEQWYCDQSCVDTRSQYLIVSDTCHTCVHHHCRDVSEQWSPQLISSMFVQGEMMWPGVTDSDKNKTDEISSSRNIWTLQTGIRELICRATHSHLVQL